MEKVEDMSNKIDNFTKDIKSEEIIKWKYQKQKLLREELRTPMTNLFLDLKQMRKESRTLKIQLYKSPKFKCKEKEKAKIKNKTEYPIALI